jgi:hypothetical protein
MLEPRIVAIRVSRFAEGLTVGAADVDGADLDATVRPSVRAH